MSIGSIDLDSLIANMAKRGPTDTEKAFRQVLPAKVSNYEVREQQIEMAKAVERALAEQRHVIAEAGTGTGKSFGYLVPSIYHVLAEGGRRVVVSTGTIALQGQLINKDIPFLQRSLGIDFKAKLAKGKSNYLCQLRYYVELPWLALGNEDALKQIIEWAGQTETGDKADLPFEPGPTWNKICVDDGCTGRKCRYVGNCFYKKAQIGLVDAQIIVTNHHLFFLDLSLRHQTSDAVSILPDYSAVVLDEAHHAESVAREALSTQVSSMRLPLLLAELRKSAGADRFAIDDARAANTAFFDTVAAGVSKDRFVFRPDEEQKGLGHDLQDTVKDVGNSFDASKASDRELKLLEQFNKFRAELGLILSGRRLDVCYWAEVFRGPRSRVNLHATPIDVSPLLREMLFSGVDTVVLTSATLSTAGSFSYLKQSIGLDECLELQTNSPFDFYNQCLLYLPTGLPDPKAADFHEQIVPFVEDLLLAVDGRAFVLFTSYAGLNQVYDRLSGRLRWNILRQGDKSKQTILDEFRATNSVLFATSSFWEGVDVQGEALSCVAIVKLPFSVPDDPITEAKVKAIEAAGGKPFFDHSLPEAILKLKQGFGRLIRTHSDRGIVAILDPRVKSKSYGRRFLLSLPRCREISSLENVDLFLKGGR